MVHLLIRSAISRRCHCQNFLTTTIISDLKSNCQLPKPVANVVIATKGLQDRNTNMIAGTTVENKGKMILIDKFYLSSKQQKRTIMTTCSLEISACRNRFTGKRILM